jgi:hypothetical protein
VKAVSRFNWIVFLGAILWAYHRHPHNFSAFYGSVVGAGLDCLLAAWLFRD